MGEVVYLGRDQILEADDLDYEDVDCPEWGGVVRVRVNLTGAERAKVSRVITAIKGGSASVRPEAIAGLPETIVTLVAIDANGERVFTDEDVRALGKKSSAPIMRIYTRVMKVSGMAPEAIEDAAGNSEASQSEGSTSD